MSTTTTPKTSSHHSSMNAILQELSYALTQQGFSTESSEQQKTSTVTLYHLSTWKTSLLHYSAMGTAWKDAKLMQLQESEWTTITIDPRPGITTTDKSSPLVEFVLTNGGGSWDKPSNGGNYEIYEPGSYAVQKGEIESIDSKPVMVVSDLDGTMIGNDNATEEFKHFWSRHAALTESVLVYNTGRSLDSFLQLLKNKAHCIAVPDVLITSVGTKIYTNQSSSWPEEQEWVHQLNQGWDVEIVKNAAASAIELVGEDNMHFRPDDEQNAHKVTCGVKKALLEEVLGHIQQKLDASDVQANVIFSGVGEWRFLDIVSKNAGKLEALNYVRKRYGFAESSTVACGDSGNDILMLSGHNLAIVVGNSQPDLLEWLNEQKTSDGERLFLASRHEAHGILEGLKKFGFY